LLPDRQVTYAFSGYNYPTRSCDKEFVRSAFCILNPKIDRTNACFSASLLRRSIDKGQRLMITFSQKKMGFGRDRCSVLLEADNGYGNNSLISHGGDETPELLTTSFPEYNLVYTIHGCNRLGYATTSVLLTGKWLKVSTPYIALAIVSYATIFLVASSK